MPEDHQNEKPLGQWADQQKKGMQKQQAAQQSSGSHPPLSDKDQRKLEDEVVRETAQGEGDDRTSADTVGQIAYAEERTSGGAGEPEKSKLEPEKQGGIGGP